MRSLLILFALYAPAAIADQFQVHLVSEHADGGNHNERNWGFGYRGDGPSAFVGGYYTNSWFRESWYAGWNWRWGHGISTTLAGVTGYADGNKGSQDDLVAGELLPLPMVHWRVFGSEISPLLSYAPTSEGGVVLLSISFRTR